MVMQAPTYLMEIKTFHSNPNYQNQQEKFLQSGRKKLKEAKRVGMPNTISLTPQEQDAFDYFHGIIKILTLCLISLIPDKVFC